MKKNNILFTFNLIICSFILIGGNVSYAQEDVKKALLEAYQSKSIDSLNSFISKYSSDTVYVDEATRIRNQLAFEQTKNKNSIEAYQEFEKLYPESLQISEVKRWISNYILNQTINTGDKDKLKELLGSTNDPNIIKKAEKGIENIVFENAKEENTIESLNDYLTKYPNGVYAKLIKERLEELQFSQGIIHYDIDELILFLNNYPNHPRHREIFDTLLSITNEYLSLKGIEYISEHNVYDIDFDKYLLDFAKEFTKDGKLNSFHRIIKSFPSLANNKLIIKRLNEAKEIDHLLSLPKIDDKIFKKYNTYFTSIKNDRSLELIKKYITPLVKFNKMANVYKVLEVLNNDFRVYQYFENISEPIAQKQNNIKESFANDSTIRVFSQKVPNSYGENDIFVSFKENDTWTYPIILPKEINSRYDEICPRINEQGDILYFYSNNGMNLSDYDLYVSFRVNKESWMDWTIPLKVSSIEKQYVIGYVNDQDKKPISTTVFIEDSISAQRLTQTLSNSVSGAFAFEKPSKPYLLISNLDKYISTYYNPSGELKLVQNSVEDMISKHKLLTIETIFSESSPDKLSKTSDRFISYLAKSLQDIPYVVTISVHTQKGYKKLSEDELSSLQANLIKDKLIVFGINSDRIVVAGYGKQSPLIGWEGKNRIEIGFIQSLGQ